MYFLDILIKNGISGYSARCTKVRCMRNCGGNPDYLRATIMNISKHFQGDHQSYYSESSVNSQVTFHKRSLSLCRQPLVHMCTSTSSPPKAVLWTTNGGPVSNSNTASSMRVTDRPTSTYKNILTVAYGMYTCTVTTTCSPVCGGFTLNPRSTTSSLTVQAPPGPPTGVTAVQSGPTSVSIFWIAPTSGDLLHQGVVNTYNTATPPPVTITGLVLRTNYTFTVIDYTITGAATQLVHTSTADIPHVTGVVVSAISTTSVRVSWLAVQLPPDGILTGYTVYYLSLPNTSKRQSGGYTSHTFPPTSTSGDINNLNPNGVYQFSVVAQVTIMEQLYSRAMDTSLAITFSTINCTCNPI
ncbi:hypothetical protein EMCRGX_G019032 [Ephydatia muelleri]